MTEEKSSGIAVVLSFFIPGLGQIYNGQIGKGIIIIILGVVFAALIFILVGIPFYIVLWVYSMYDAYKFAEATHNKGKSQNKKDPHESGEAIIILKKRYANGEITKSQYTTMRKNLE